MTRLLVFGLTLLLASASAAEPKKSDVFQDLSLKEALAKAKKGKKVVMVEFYLDSCPVCKAFAEKTLPDKDVQQLLKDKTVAIKSEVSKGVPKELVKVAAVPSGKERLPVPTFVFL